MEEMNRSLEGINRITDCICL